MNTKTHYALVGLFVIMLSFALIAAIFWLGFDRNDKIYDKYQAYMNESVSGLNIKAPVKYRGVEVGQVIDISLVPERPNDVFLLLEIARETPIKTDTYATLSTQGLTGLAFIELTGGSVEASAPKRKEGEKYPEIKTKPSLLVRVDSTITTLSKNINKVSTVADDLLHNLKQLSDNLNQVFSPENQIAIHDSLHALASIGKTLDNQKPNIEASLQSAAQLLAQSNQVAKRTYQLIGRMENTLTSVETTSQQFGQTAKTLETVVKNTQSDIQKTSQNLQQTSVSVQKAVKSSRRDVDLFMQQILPQLTYSLQELHELLNTLHSLTRELERKPNMLLFGKSAAQPGPGEQ